MAGNDPTTADTNGQRMIYDLVREPAHAAIQKEIDTTVSNVRNGIVETDTDGDGKPDKKATFWDKIKAFFMMLIFNLAEAFGFEKGLAKMFGMPIPEKKEVDNLSHQVAESVSHSLANDQLQFANREEFKTALNDQLLGSLHRERAKYPSFSNEHLAETAKHTVESIAPQFDNMFDEQGKRKDPTQRPVVQLIAASTFKDQFNAEMYDNKDNNDLKGKLVQLSNNANFGERDIGYISTALAPALVKYGATPPSKDMRGFEDVAETFKAALVANQGSLNTTGAQWTPERLDLLADHVTVKYMKSQHSTDAPDAFNTRITEKESGMAAEIGTAQIKTQVSNAIRATVAAEVMEKYDNSTWYSTNNSGGYAKVDDEIKALQQFYTKDSKGKYHLKSGVNPNDRELVRLQEKLHEFAAKDSFVSSNKAPTIGQREKISEVVAQTVVDTLKDPQHTGSSDVALHALIQQRIKAALESRTKEIDAAGPAGHTIEAINANLEQPLYEMIAEKFVKEMAVKENSASLKTLREGLTAVSLEDSYKQYKDPSRITNLQYENAPPTFGNGIVDRGTAPQIT